MLSIYQSVDMMQVFLYLQEASIGVTFWTMLGIGEVSSMFKNCGGMEVLSWVFGVRKTFPYHDSKTVETLKAMALVDSMSELLAGLGAFTVFAFEKEALESGIGEVYKITAVNETDGVVVASYQSRQCFATCVGWTVNDLEPPPEELQSRVELMILFMIIAAIRLLFLFGEYALLDYIQARYEKPTDERIAPFLGEGKEAAGARLRQRRRSSRSKRRSAELRRRRRTGGGDQLRSCRRLRRRLDCGPQSCVRPSLRRWRPKRRPQESENRRHRASWRPSRPET